jgi:uncharacterized protein YjbI with pentapeptide repeats
MPSRIKAALSPPRVGIGWGFIALSIILMVVVAWDPAFRYFTDPKISWREKVAIGAGIAVCVGLVLVTVHRSGQKTEDSQHAEDSQHTEDPQHTDSSEHTGGPQHTEGPPSAHPKKSKPPKPRDWVALAASSLPGIAAVIALVFTALSVQATNGQLRVTQNQLKITEQGQYTDRYNAAITNLASRSIDVRLGGIYALQRLMRDSPRDQTTIVAVLCSFARDKIAPKQQKSPAPSLPPDVQAALTVVGNRNTSNNGHPPIIDLNHVVLTGAQLTHADLTGANLAGATLTGANLSRASLTGANLTGAILAGANLTGANLTGVDLHGARLAHVALTDANLTGVNLTDANLTGAVLADTNLAGANLLGADLVRAVLSHENMPNLSLIGADLIGADLSGANLSQGNLTGAVLVRAKFNNAVLTSAVLIGANLKRAVLRQAILTGANLANANLTEANLFAATLPGRANLAGVNPTHAYWPMDAAVPEGWRRIPGSPNYLEP